MGEQGRLSIIGADISHLKQIEDFGGRFYLEGRQTDCVVLLRNHGFNFIRLKVWNDPGLPLSAPAGYNGKKSVVEMAKRVKRSGFNLLIDFHYSDFWADPNKQTKPKAWEKLDFQKLRHAVYSFTKDVVQSLCEQNAVPDMIQIGNEIDNGMLWDDGKIDGTAGQWDKFCALLSSGISGALDGAREARLPGDDKPPAIMIHKADGCDHKGAEIFFDTLLEREVSFDCIGFSFYPFFHGTFEALQKNLEGTARKYQKDVIIAETAWGWTRENGNDNVNLITGGGPVRLPFSVIGQKRFLKRVADIIRNVPDGKGKGFFYWEPSFIPVRGAGWKYGEGDEWANMTLFDFFGNALDSLNIFRAL